MGANDLLAIGKRDLLVNNIPEAVSNLAKACELLSKQFGETAKECAEVYYYYGKSLLELSRMESGVLGNALEGVPEEESESNTSQFEDPSKLTDKEKTEVTEKIADALEENIDELEKMKEKAEEEKKELMRPRNPNPRMIQRKPSQRTKPRRLTVKKNPRMKPRARRRNPKRTRREKAARTKLWRRTRRSRLAMKLETKPQSPLMRRRTRRSLQTFSWPGRCLSWPRSSTPSWSPTLRRRRSSPCLRSSAAPCVASAR